MTNIRTPISGDSIRPVIDWVLAEALTDFDLEKLIIGIAERLTEAGYLLHRLHVTARVLHPIYSGMSFTWSRHREFSQENYQRGDDQSDNWLQSPLRYVLENDLDEYHLRIYSGEGIKEYPIISDLSKDGATDYFVCLSRFGDPETAIQRRDGLVVTWTGYGAEGWSEADLSDLRRLQSRVAVAVRLAMSTKLAENVATAYLGTDAGMRVLSGQIQRGDGEEIDAVVWFSDLRSSTRLAEELGRERYLILLNQFFECTASSVAAENGEILGYIGDSVLAIFSFAKFDGAVNASSHALAAANNASARVASLNQERGELGVQSIGFGIGLHCGSVTFGNIGIPERLSFSVIGSIANEAARITDKCRDLGEEIVVSEEFSKNTKTKWKRLGKFDLRNVNYPMALFAPEKDNDG